MQRLLAESPITPWDTWGSSLLAVTKTFTSPSHVWADPSPWSLQTR